ncbi:hypothetical protein ACQ4PT_055040 [Festuca glaucescens]
MSPPTATPMLLVLASALLILATAADNPTAEKGCKSLCGDVHILYPFGIGKGCFRQGFEIICTNSSGETSVPYLPGSSVPPADHVGSSILQGMLTGMVPVLSLSVAPRAEVRVRLKVAYECFNTLGNRTNSDDGAASLTANSVYRISNTHNELFVLGCSTFIYTGSGLPGRFGNSYYGGCVAYCNDEKSAQDGACEGIGCCHVDLPPGLTDTRMQLSTWPHAGLDYSPCNYAFIVEKGNYSFKKDDLSMPINTTMPLLLDWAIRDSVSCHDATSKAGYGCVSNNSHCNSSTNGPGYVCQCNEGYDGNPYVLGVNGCQDIDECSRIQNACPDNSHCTNRDGSYTCKCRRGYQLVGDPKTGSCNPKFSFAAKISIGMVLGATLLVIALLSAYILFQKRQLDKAFEKNGGKILENVKGLTIFTKDELKKITKNNSYFLGNGSFGKVYKGILPDDTIVAVKSSVTVNETSRKDFTDEVEIQTNMIHKNILRLLGCCLEVDVPMLKIVYGENQSLIIEFCKVYEKEDGGRALFDMEIGKEEDMFVLEEISKLAVDCLDEDIEVRPDMTEVAERLVMLRRDKKFKKSLQTHEQSEDITPDESPMH